MKALLTLLLVTTSLFAQAQKAPKLKTAMDSIDYFSGQMDLGDTLPRDKTAIRYAVKYATEHQPNLDSLNHYGLLPDHPLNALDLGIRDEYAHALEAKIDSLKGQIYYIQHRLGINPGDAVYENGLWNGMPKKTKKQFYPERNEESSTLLLRPRGKIVKVIATDPPWYVYEDGSEEHTPRSGLIKDAIPSRVKIDSSVFIIGSSVLNDYRSGKKKLPVKSESALRPFPDKKEKAKRLKESQYQTLLYCGYCHAVTYHKYRYTNAIPQHECGRCHKIN